MKLSNPTWKAGSCVLGGAVLSSLLLGCKVSPTFQTPKVPVGHGWTQPGDPGAPPVELETWWRHFGDPTLDRLVEAAFAGNLDVRQAQMRIAEARGLRDAAAGGKGPTVDLKADVARQHQTLNGPLPIGIIPGMARDQTIHEVGFDAAWELDLFGGVRRRVESADAQAAAAVENSRNARVSVAAEVARTYLTMRGAQRELEAQKASVEAQRRLLETIRMRTEAGDLSRADLERAKGLLQDAEASLPALRAQMRAAALGLGVLLGQLPESEAALAESAPIDLVLTPIPVGERADLLRRRPDVRAAEMQLASATADIGVAKAEWFPKLAISAGGGFEALRMADLFKSTSQMLSVTPLISWRIFDGGTIKAQIRVAEARQETAALAYEKAVLTALTDAERALSTYRLALEADQSRTASLDSARRTYQHMELRFKAGDISLGDLLDSERSLRQSEDASAKARTDAAVDLVALYKALGGGWQKTAS